MKNNIYYDAAKKYLETKTSTEYLTEMVNIGHPMEASSNLWHAIDAYEDIREIYPEDPSTNKQSD